MGDLDAVSREFAREYSGRLWKQLVMPASGGGESSSAARTEAVVVAALAVVSALAFKVPELFGIELNGDTGGFYARNVSFFVLPLLTGYFAWKRKLDRVTCGQLALTFVIAAVFANLFPFTPGGTTEVLTALHLPIALGLAVGVAYAGGHWKSVVGRMNFVRFSGELFIYYALIAFGGGVLTVFTLGMFQSIGLDVEWFAQGWLLPCGALGAVIIGAWLVEGEAKRHRKHGASPHAPLHATLHPRPPRVPWHHGVDTKRHRREARGAHRIRSAVGTGPRSPALRCLGP